MSSLNCNTRILNVTRGGKTVKLNQALHAIAEGVADWVEKNVSIRDLTLAEVVERRNARGYIPESLGSSEIHGLRYEPPTSDTWQLIHGAPRRAMIMLAHEEYKQFAV